MTVEIQANAIVSSLRQRLSNQLFIEIDLKLTAREIEKMGLILEAEVAEIDLIEVAPFSEEGLQEQKKWKVLDLLDHF